MCERLSSGRHHTLFRRRRPGRETAKEVTDSFWVADTPPPSPFLILTHHLNKGSEGHDQIVSLGAPSCTPNVGPDSRQRLACASNNPPAPFFFCFFISAAFVRRSRFARRQKTSAASSAAHTSPAARATARDSILTAPLQPWLPLVRPVGPFVCFRFSSLDHQCYTSCFVAAVCSSESQVDFRVLSTLILFLFLRIMEKENHFSLCIQLVRRTPPPIYLQSYYESSCCFM